MNGGLWCSPTATTSSPTSSAFLAISTVALIRSCSVGVRPVVGSGVTSPTVKMPNCMSLPLVQRDRCAFNYPLNVVRNPIIPEADFADRYPVQGMCGQVNRRGLEGERRCRGGTFDVPGGGSAYCFICSSVLSSCRSPDRGYA